MSSIRFGETVEDPIAEIATRANAVRKAIGNKQITGFDLKLIKLDIYHEVFLKSEPVPYSTMMVHPQEDVWTNNPTHDRIAEHMINDVYARTGLNVTEFLQLPTATCEFIINRLRREGEEKRRAANSLKDKIGQGDDPADLFKSLKR